MQAMNAVTRFLAPSVLAAALGMGFAMPVPQAQAQDDLTRVLVDIADVVFRAGTPYYRYGQYGQYDRLVVQRDHYGRPVYYRYMPNGYNARYNPPYGNAYGYRGKGNDRYYRDVDCNKHGKCKVTYYDPRYDRHHDDRRWDDRRWRDRDDD